MIRALGIRPVLGGANGEEIEETVRGIAHLISQMTALGRPGVPDDIGPMIASLLSDENRWVNAQRIEVSGGLAL